jgi:hypothetical protein
VYAPHPASPQPSAHPPTRGVRLTFTPGVLVDEVAATLDLSLFAIRSMFGDDAVSIDGVWVLEPGPRAVTIDTSTRVGRSLALVFLGYVRREFRDENVGVLRFSGRKGGAA